MNLQIRILGLQALVNAWSRHVFLINLTWYNPYETVTKENLNYLIFKPNSPCEWYLLTSAECLEIRFILLRIQPIIFIHFTNLWNETVSFSFTLNYSIWIKSYFSKKIFDSFSLSGKVLRAFDTWNVLAYRNCQIRQLIFILRIKAVL